MAMLFCTLCIGAGPGLAGPARAGPLLGEPIELYYVAYKERPSVVDGRQVYNTRPVNAVVCTLTRPQYRCVWERDKQAMSCEMLHVYQFCVQAKQLQG